MNNYYDIYYEIGGQQGVERMCGISKEYVRELFFIKSKKRIKEYNLPAGHEDDVLNSFFIKKIVPLNNVNEDQKLGYLIFGCALIIIGLIIWLFT